MDRVLSTASGTGTPVCFISPANRSEKLSDAKALDNVPPRVIPIWMVARNLPGSDNSFFNISIFFLLFSLPST